MAKRKKLKEPSISKEERLSILFNNINNLLKLPNYTLSADDIYEHNEYVKCLLDNFKDIVIDGVDSIKMIAIATLSDGSQSSFNIKCNDSVGYLTEQIYTEFTPLKNALAKNNLAIIHNPLTQQAPDLFLVPANNIEKINLVINDLLNSASTCNPNCSGKYTVDGKNIARSAIGNLLKELFSNNNQLARVELKSTSKSLDKIRGAFDIKSPSTFIKNPKGIDFFSDSYLINSWVREDENIKFTDAKLFKCWEMMGPAKNKAINTLSSDIRGKIRPVNPGKDGFNSPLDAHNAFIEYVKPLIGDEDTKKYNSTVSRVMNDVYNIDLYDLGPASELSLNLN